MEVLSNDKTPPVFLSNHEVFKLLNELKGQMAQQQGSNTSTQSPSPLATILYETSHYLQDMPCSKQSDEVIKNALLALKQFPVELTKNEKLMIINNPPTSQLQLSTIVKDLEDRMTEEQIESFLELVSKQLVPNE